MGARVAVAYGELTGAGVSGVVAVVVMSGAGDATKGVPGCRDGMVRPGIVRPMGCCVGLIPGLFIVFPLT